jgi:hypothetical protein
LIFSFFLLLQPARARTPQEIWAAWVSDQACGALHTKPGGVDCIRKCRRGGASVGHPEWKPQRAVLVKDSDKSVWFIENPEMLDGHEGEPLTVNVSVNRPAKSVRVKSFVLAKEGNAP